MGKKPVLFVSDKNHVQTHLAVLGEICYIFVYSLYNVCTA